MNEKAIRDAAKQIMAQLTCAATDGTVAGMAAQWGRKHNFTEDEVEVLRDRVEIKLSEAFDEEAKIIDELEQRCLRVILEKKLCGPEWYAATLKIRHIVGEAGGTERWRQTIVDTLIKRIID